MKKDLLKLLTVTAIVVTLTGCGDSGCSANGCSPDATPTPVVTATPTPTPVVTPTPAPTEAPAGSPGADAILP
jgi:multidrug efflux pump subunit AcrA (membrane-fusion protein)